MPEMFVCLSYTVAMCCISYSLCSSQPSIDLRLRKRITPSPQTPSDSLLTHHSILSLLTVERPASLLESPHFLRIPQQFPLMPRTTWNLPTLLHRRPLKHPFLPLLQGREIAELNPSPSTQRHPAPETDVCDCALLSDQIRGAFGSDVGVEHGVQATDLVLGSCLGVRKVFTRVAHVMVCLALDGAYACILEEEPVLSKSVLIPIANNCTFSQRTVISILSLLPLG
jgi:hypothetical protein